jgi:ribosomal protein S18 acetylase RimI-like enzyme
MDIDIRAATPEDAVGIAAVPIAGWQAAYQEILPASYLGGLSVEDSASPWRRRIEARSPGGRGRVLVAVERGLIAGFNSFGPSQDSDANGWAEVFAFYVAPDRWRLGIGRALMQAGVVGLRESGFDEVRLWVLEDNAIGRAFYEKDGWLRDGERRLVDTRLTGGAEVVEVRYRKRPRLESEATPASSSDP